MTELGNHLREAREEKGWSLDDLQHMTKIQKRYLRGIEEGNYEVMPGQFYVRAFIKQYAETVGLDPELIFEQYAAEFPQTVKEDIPELSRVQTKKLPEATGKLLDIFPKILIAVFIIGALTAVWYFWPYKGGGDATPPVSEQDNPQIKVEDTGKLTDDDTNDDTDDNSSDNNDSDGKGEEEPEVADVEKDAQELTLVENTGRTTTYELKNSTQFNLKVTSPGESWIEIRNGKGYVFYSGVVTAGQPAGEEVDLTNESEVVIVVGRATEADIYVNDEKLSYAIPPADQVRQDIVIKFVKDNE